MAYSTLNDIKKLISEASVTQLTDDENTGAVNQTRVDEAIAQADAEIDTYCGQVFTVPFTTVPDIVKKASVDIAIYNLYSRRVEQMPETRRDRYKDAIALLTKIAEGKISIGEQPEPASPGEGGVQSTKTLDDRIFTSKSMSGF
ncbi:MAG: DUF1320 domain-containing protein [Candidatus Jettenia sp.]|uniref:Hypothetical phage protein n=1 Tax=Candidatus Jettenia caeni TaxID=247490 RepID=I3ILQ5_9BACT|nr:DUF1320 domain-containing protein [Candidatus Jettenia sp. AMX1]KAA0243566.1 MAG: DUF1320 domain-containing protein [Candidatus Brocadia sp. AMX2]MBC6930223.1 DUF1320 domain-containing protein [Candidatus Jettenia sp.]GAB62650.1 hypothetical phage protein [Candidatus Jettenia caeni]MCQ3927096.1 DUF1320 domain-containing protein [Candidatus Jettenia sp.]MDL1939880.1 DUF1320 domain-containing protein [Candidatus Jettenia sp. AMX1]